MQSGVYLIHFNEPVGHARHYLGSAASRNRRLKQHWRGAGARLMGVVRDRGIGWSVARVWPARDARSARLIERGLKRRHGSVKLCPVCKEAGRATVR